MGETGQGIDFSKFNMPERDKLLTERDVYEETVMSQESQKVFDEQTKKERRGLAKNTLLMTPEETATYQAEDKIKTEAAVNARVHEDALKEDAIREARKRAKDA